MAQETKEEIGLKWPQERSKGFGDTLDKEEERDAMCLKDKYIPGSGKEAKQAMPFFLQWK